MVFNLFILHRAGNLVVPNVSTEVSDVSSSSGPVKLADLQRILNNLSSGPVGKILNRLVLPSISFSGFPLIYSFRYVDIILGIPGDEEEGEYFQV